MDLQLRNANIGIAVGIVVLIAGVGAFRDAGEGALQIVMLVTLIVMFGVTGALNQREDRLRKRDQ